MGLLISSRKAVIFEILIMGKCLELVIWFNFDGSFLKFDGSLITSRKGVIFEL